MGRSFVLRKLHSFIGIFPLSLFMAWHLFVNSFLGQGAAQFNSVVVALHKIPYLWAVEIILLGCFLLHVIYGFYIIITAKNNIASYGYVRSWMFLLQRVTAIIIIVFLAYHVIVLRLSGMEVNYQSIREVLSNPSQLAILLIGGGATILHLANGLSTFLISWGITVGQRAQKFFAYGAVLVFLVFALMGLRITGFLV